MVAVMVQMMVTGRSVDRIIIIIDCSKTPSASETTCLTWRCCRPADSRPYARPRGPTAAPAHRSHPNRRCPAASGGRARSVTDWLLVRDAWHCCLRRLHCRWCPVTGTKDELRRSRNCVLVGAVAAVLVSPCAGTGTECAGSSLLLLMMRVSMENHTLEICYAVQCLAWGGGEEVVWGGGNLLHTLRSCCL